MKTQLFLASLLLLATLPLSAGSDSVTVHLLVDLATDAPVFADCDVTVPAGSNVAAVLDQAQADGCIVQWGCTDFGFDCFVDSIDFVPGQAIFYWAYYVDGEYAEAGVFGTTVHDGGDYHFAFDQWAIFPSPL